MIQVFEVHAGRDGKPGLSVQDIKIAYSGNKSDTRLEAALKGPMQSMLPENERASIINWVRSGSQREEYESKISKIIGERCLICHDGSDPHRPNLTNFENIKELSKMDTGTSIATLVRVSHIHMLGIPAAIFIPLGFIFLFVHTKKKRAKAIALAVPFIAIFLDIASWYLTKVSDIFAFTVMFGGALMAISFAYQWFTCIYQIWWFECDSDYCDIP
ncbi:hypothetical protein HY249_03165 [Candidatus Azambacteria bacterium]|nr:hypothetical protein [Candidatus Azambacteria bacterium]